MLLIDLSQVVIAALMVQVANGDKITLDESIIRQMALDSLRAGISKFKKSHSDVIVCCDTGEASWRKDIFPYYKAGRGKSKSASIIDWGMINKFLNKFKQELKDNFPYKVLEVPKAEADDIIAVMANHLTGGVTFGNPLTSVMIFSNDKDFIQLQSLNGVSQYSSLHKRIMKVTNPEYHLKELVIRGDRIDGIPNFLSPDDSFVTGQRQKPINSKKLEIWLKQSPNEFCLTDSHKRWFMRNEMLIDFKHIPPKISKDIIHAYETTGKGSKNKMLKYFMEHGLTRLIPLLDEF